MDSGCEAYEYNVTLCLYLCISSCTMDSGCEAYEYNVTICLYLSISSCTMDSGCGAYEYNITDEGTCHLLNRTTNRTSSAVRTLFSGSETSLFVKGT